MPGSPGRRRKNATMNNGSNIVSIHPCTALRNEKRAAVLVSGCPLALAEATEEYLLRAERIGADREQARRALVARMKTMPINLSFDKAFADLFPGMPN
jgi:hypothetical protein